jgi:hypothetical protein
MTACAKGATGRGRVGVGSARCRFGSTLPNERPPLVDTTVGNASVASSAVMGATSSGFVRVFAWIWTRVLTERLRLLTMWWLKEKVAVRVVAVVPGPHGSILAGARCDRLTLPSVRLDRNANPEAAVREYVREACDVVAANWPPVDAVRRPGSRLDAIFVADAPRQTGTGGARRATWVTPSTIKRGVLPRWSKAGVRC